MEKNTKGIKNIPIGYKKLYFPAAFSKENKFVVAGVKDNIYIWETSYGVFVKTLDAHYGRISTLVASFGGETKNLVLSASMDKTIKIWNINNILEQDFQIDHFEKPIEMLHVSIQAQIAMVMTRNQLGIVSLKDGKIKYSLCHSPHGAIFGCSALSQSGAIAVSSESNRLVMWDMEEKKTTFVAATASNQLQIKQLKFHQAEVYVLAAYLDVNTKNITISNFLVPDGDIIFNIEYGLKQGTEYKEFVVTSDDQYIVIYRNDKKQDMLSIHTATDGECAHTIKLSYTNYIPELFTMVTMHEKPHYVVLVDAEKGNIINVKDKKFVRSVLKWNGKATKDDKFGLYAPTRGGLELIELKNGTKVKTFIPKVAEGVFDVDTLITENDKHIIYYHSGKRTIRVFNVETTKQIANYKSAARVRCMIAAQDGKSIIFGCEDGTVNMLIIADPMYEDYVQYLRDWRADQMAQFGREVVDEDTPPNEKADDALENPVANAINFQPEEIAQAPKESSEPPPSVVEGISTGDQPIMGEEVPQDGSGIDGGVGEGPSLEDGLGDMNGEGMGGDMMPSNEIIDPNGGEMGNENDFIGEENVPNENTGEMQTSDDNANSNEANEISVETNQVLEASIIDESGHNESDLVNNE